jgi:hypothetical protein
MKQVFRYASLLFLGGALLISSCSKKSDDPTETPTPVNPPIATGEQVCLDGKKTQVLIDASTKAGAASIVKGYACDVTTTQLTDTIVLDIKAPKDLDKIYITLSQDNGPATPYYVPSNLVGFDANTDTYNKTFTAGGAGLGYSLDIPDGLASTKYIKVKIPVTVRTSPSAQADIYTIWITNGTGSFDNTGKKTIIGPLNVALVYGAAIPYVAGFGINLGDQNATNPSYVSTSGSINTISGVALIESGMTADEKTVALNGADINFVSLRADGSSINLATAPAQSFPGTPYFIGVGLRSSVGFTGNTEGTDKTKFELYTGTKAFADFNGGDIKALANPTKDRIKVENNKIYVFLTEDGRKGIINVTNLAVESVAAVAAAARLEAGGHTATVSVKVLTK